MRCCGAELYDLVLGEEGGDKDVAVALEEFFGHLENDFDGLLLDFSRGISKRGDEAEGIHVLLCTCGTVSFM